MMKKLFILSIAALALTACELKDAVKSVNEMPGDLGEMKSQMNELDYKQTLLLTSQGMEKPENQASFAPFPSAMMPYGKKFAEAANETDFLDYVKLKLKQISEVNPSNGVDANGNEVALTQDQLKDLYISKNGTLYSLFIISGYYPDNKLADMIQNQIVHNGPYRQYALNVLMMRVIFWRDLYLDGDLLEKSLSSSGLMNEAIQDLDKIGYVLNLPFVKQVKLTVKDGVHNFVDLDQSLGDAATFAATTGEWQKVYNNALDAAHSYEQGTLTGDPATDKELLRQEVAAQAQALATLKAQTDKWKTKTP